jgi:hypothetical protein
VPEIKADGGNVSTADPFADQLPWPEFRQLYAYWRARCDGDHLPSRSDIDPLAFPALLPGIYLVDVIRTPGSQRLGFRFRLVGTAHLAINGIEITGLTVDEAFTGDHGRRAREAYEEVVASARPSLAIGARAAVGGRAHMVYDRLLLPLAGDGRTIDMLLGHLRAQPAR